LQLQYTHKVYSWYLSRDPNIPEDTEDKSWSQKGIEHFNKLRKFIIMDRPTHPMCMANWLKQEREKLKNKKADKIDEDDSMGVIDANNGFVQQP
jgi:hypothetical protein